jgi:mRNA interferase RelE/StbE
LPSYDIRFKTSARKELAALEDYIALRVLAKIEGLAAQPRPNGCKKLRGAKDLWRVRAGDYRIVYGIDDRAQEITVLRVRHRREVYDGS